ncbi:class I SAM-dependent methyltransferase [Bacillus sp. FJAT-45037]|uniref:class I SAM-dependent methyltransferase n=1 Tax=Bacillus sp. FJAT-45037 TaxID=2011007 RepID=UPI000C23D4A2|nr:class I SAM-dependent methyltransferase [Bacillus sp. FJAT-45037]
MEYWYEEHFNEDYLMVYKHRNDELAQHELQKLMTFIPYKKGQYLLDLCCGNGRHSRWFFKKGLHVTGVDLSETLLEDAKKQQGSEDIQYIRSDMRHITFLNQFDVVVNLFTSFGYFEDDLENEQVLKNAYNALVPQGYFIFDYLNPAFLEKNLVPFSKEVIDQLSILQYRTIEDNTVIKKIKIEDQEGSKRQYEERVKLYSREQLDNMIKQSGFQINHTFGDYDGSLYNKTQSSRLIYVCQK